VPRGGELAALGYEVEVWYQIDGPFRAELARGASRRFEYRSGRADVAPGGSASGHMAAW
jgi:hypothetical protein